VIEPVAAEIGRYIVEAGLERPAIVGHSLGGSWAMMVGAAHPNRVSRIMVVDMMPWLGAMFGPAASSPEALRTIAGQIRQGMTGQTETARRAQTEAMIATMVRTEALRPGVTRQSLDSDPAVSALAFYELVLADLRPSLARLAMPLKVVWAHPPGAPIGVEQMAQYYTLSYSRAPNASVERIENSWHFIMFDQPERFRAELAEFLRGS